MSLYLLRAFANGSLDCINGYGPIRVVGLVTVCGFLECQAINPAVYHKLTVTFALIADHPFLDCRIEFSAAQFIQAHAFTFPEPLHLGHVFCPGEFFRTRRFTVTLTTCFAIIITTDKYAVVCIGIFTAIARILR